jgi:hypothetical protein
MLDHQRNPESRRIGSTEKKIDIRDGQRTTGTEAGWSGRRPGGVGADL